MVGAFFQSATEAVVIVNGSLLRGKGEGFF
jgi:hypothetical protein